MSFFVYILTSQKNGTLYIGSTDNLAHRVWMHKQGRGAAFTRQHNCKRLVWYDSTIPGPAPKYANTKKKMETRLENRTD